MNTTRGLDNDQELNGSCYWVACAVRSEMSQQQTTSRPVAVSSVVETHERTIGGDREDLLRRPGRLVATHARRVARHSGNRQPNSVRPIRQQSLHGLDWDVSLHDVAVDHCRVTRRRLIRNPPIQSTLPSIRVVLEPNFDPVVCQVPDPACATASTRVAPYIHDNAIEPGRCVTRSHLRAARSDIRSAAASNQH